MRPDKRFTLAIILAIIAIFSLITYSVNAATANQGQSPEEQITLCGNRSN